MLKLFVSLLVIFSVFILFSPTTSALDENVLIKRFQAGGSGSGTSQQEFIELYNESDTDIDITNWCIFYNDTSEIVCFSPPDAQTKLYLTSKSSILVVSPQFIAANPMQQYDFVFGSNFTSNIPGTNGSIKLTTSDTSYIVDRLGWGNGIGEGTSSTGNIPGGQNLERQQDTGNNITDFLLKTTSFPIQHGGVYEKEVQIDLCPNLPGLDISVPVGYIKDTDGNCYEDVCDNIADLQKTLPVGFYQNGIDCEPIGLIISEILPNASGSDTGNEYIELYNPTDYDTNLNAFYLQLGPSFSKNYNLPDVPINSQQYIYLTDTQTGITLPNSTASLRLFSNDNQQIDETDSYTDPSEDTAWALIDNQWQYTNQPTPGKENASSKVGTGAGVDEEVAPCPEGKYRNPETNRCKTIETNDLKPCAADQVRNPETNRCRSILSSNSSNLTTCKAGQTRNPETNRCRNASSTSNQLKPCAPNQERNIETNRCRKKINSTMTDIKDIGSEVEASHNGWIMAGTAGVGLAGYGVAEWRTEIATGLRRLRQLLGKTPPDA